MKVSHIENHIDEQSSHMQFIASAVSNLMSVGVPNISTHRIETRRAALNDIWNKFSVNNDAIKIALRQVSARDKERLLKTSYFKDNLFEATREGYLEALETMSSLIEIIQKDTRSPSIQAGSQAASFPSIINFGPRLPNLNLPTFDGSPSEWLPFKDLFDSLVITNTNLTPLWKLHYLKQSLRGTASHLLKNTALTTDNFQKAWDSLVSFYENKRLLVNSALHSLMTVKRMTRESAVEMENLYTTITQIYRSLETLGRPVSTWDDILVFVSVQRLDPDSIKAREHHLGSSKNPPTWKQFIEFLMTRLLTLQAVEKSRKSLSHSHQQSAKARLAYSNQASETFSNASKTSSSASRVFLSKCSICSLNHYAGKCPHYANQTVQRRLEIIKNKNLCFNCLGRHVVSKCKSTKRCKKCGKKHHSTIHKVEPSTKSDLSTSNQVVQANCASINQSSSIFRTLLATVQVNVISEKGEKIKIRALVDPGSQISFISERLVQKLRLPRQQSTIPLLGIAAIKAGRTRGLVSVQLAPYFESSAVCVITAYVLPKLTSKFSSIKANIVNWPHLKDIQLADPDFQLPGYVDLIIGADYYGQILEEGLRRGSGNTPTAQATIFGWILFGPTEEVCSAPAEIQSFHTSIDQELYDLLQKFWKLDELPTKSTLSLSIEDQECEDLFKLTHSRDSDGRYIVKLPLKKSTELLGDSRPAALKMLSRLSNKLQLNSALQKAYSDFLTEYQDLQHMKVVPESDVESSQPVYYIPHHGVIRESSITTKLRVVFNASSRTTSGLSLNDILHTGAKLQTELVDVLIWFRQFRYVFNSDIEKMYRQIKVHPSNWNLQRILWSKEPDKILTFQLTTVTYGLASAPFLALRAMQQLIEDEGSKFPLAIAILKKGRYVDDIFGGADSIEESQKTLLQVKDMCMAGGLPLQKWTSNEPRILEGIPPEKQLFPSSVPIDQSVTVHALGMNWNPISDSFCFTWTKPLQNKLTKRTVLSTIARLFDPLGLLSPITINAKIFIQDLWSLKLDWDDPLPSRLSDKWTQFTHQLEELSSLSFPRWLGKTAQSSIEIHGFCDASQQALAAVVYLRSTQQGGKVQTVLICSKTKVAPIKRMTIPRLELSAAVIVTKLISHVLQVFDHEKISVHMWTDSAIAYTWINNHPSRWKDFVHNRVCFIQESIPSAKWHFIPGKENPADCATRGLTAFQLFQHSVWWNGPVWLQLSPDSWPNHFETPSTGDNLEERSVLTTSTTVAPIKNYWPLVNKYSNLNKLLRITALCKRFILCLKKKAKSVLEIPITTQELEEAKHYWIRVTQCSSFNREYKLLSKGRVITKFSLSFSFDTFYRFSRIAAPWRKTSSIVTSAQFKTSIHFAKRVSFYSAYYI